MRCFERVGELADLERGGAAHLDWEAEPSVLALWGFILEIEEVAVLRQLAPEPGSVLAPCIDVASELGELYQAHGALQLGRAQIVAKIDKEEARVKVRIARKP